jgi:Fe-S-cluster containining protein
MEFFQPQIPTPRLKKAETRLRHILSVELGRLRLRGKYSGSLEVAGDFPLLLDFAKEFHVRYSNWQYEALKQHREPIQCQAGCSNCCQHYPMSVEPIELLWLYQHLRGREDFGRIIEECFRRVQAYQGLRSNHPPLTDEEDDAILQSFFALGLRCPLLGEGGLCSAHEWRPVTCRMYFSFTHPDFCTPKHLLTANNRSFHICLPDAIEEDIAEVAEFWAELELPESLYEGLLTLNTWEGEGCFP